MSTAVPPDNEPLRDKLQITESQKEERKKGEKELKREAWLILLATWMGSCDLRLGAFRCVCLIRGPGTTKWPPDV